jgi:subtilisin family serine protease
VINMSLAGPASSTLQTAVRYAYGKGCVIAAAAGNAGSSVPSYPAGYAEVIAVGSVYRDALSSFSNYGPHLDVVAPGETIDTIAPGNTYGRFSGTSAATPFVAGLAALVLAAAPGASPTQVMSAITSTARDLGSPGWDQYYGFGHIDAAAALSALGTTPPPVNTEPDAPEPPTPPQDTQAPTVSITAPASGSVVSGIVTIRAIASDDGAVQRVEFYANGVLLGSDSTAPYQLDWNAKRFSGPYEIRAVAVDGAGNKTVSEPVLVTVQASIKTPPKKS